MANEAHPTPALKSSACVLMLACDKRRGICMGERAVRAQGGDDKMDVGVRAEKEEGVPWHLRRAKLCDQNKDAASCHGMRSYGSTSRTNVSRNFSNILSLSLT